MEKQGSLTYPIDCGLSNSPVLLNVACQMTHRPLFFRSLCVTKARKCHHMRRRRYNCRFREPYARQKKGKNKMIDLPGTGYFLSLNAQGMSKRIAFYRTTVTSVFRNKDIWVYV